MPTINQLIRKPRRVQASKSKTVHVIHIRHRDEVEAPITDWLEEAYLASKKRA